MQLTAEMSKAPSLSRDGNALAIGSNPAAAFELRVIDLRTGKQRTAAGGRGKLASYVINSSGTSIVCDIIQDEKATLWQVSSSDGLPRKLFDQSFDATDWSPDSRYLLGVLDELRPEITILDLQTSKLRKFLTDMSGRQLWQAHFSTDGHWVTFNATSPGHSQLYIAPFRNAVVPASEWIPITDGSGWDDKPRFSHNDKLLFFTSDRDGHRCIWAQPLSAEMRPIGNPRPVYHSHRSGRSIGNTSISTLELSVGPNMIVFNEQEFAGNLWLLDPLTHHR